MLQPLPSPRASFSAAASRNYLRESAKNRKRFVLEYAMEMRMMTVFRYGVSWRPWFRRLVDKRRMDRALARQMRLAAMQLADDIDRQLMSRFLGVGAGQPARPRKARIGIGLQRRQLQGVVGAENMRNYKG